MLFVYKRNDEKKKFSVIMVFAKPVFKTDKYTRVTGCILLYSDRRASSENPEDDKKIFFTS